MEGQDRCSAADGSVIPYPLDAPRATSSRAAARRNAADSRGQLNFDERPADMGWRPGGGGPRSARQRTERGTTLEHDCTYTRDDVLRVGFEARCIDVDGARYVWHGDRGLRVDSRTGTTTLIMDPAKLPEGPWIATQLGEEEIAAAK